ncbi:hypothetical protein SDC9_143972 [bioreactor metagenome]|uniref:Uncharacterized protein n=1 Tax=bioreactor metagenome TaxID=1076179 RepID=A0A645E4Y9_9ZZZZ
MQLPKDRLAKAYGCPLYNAGNHPPDGIPFVLDFLDKVDHLICLFGIGASNGRVFDSGKVVLFVVVVQFNFTYL